MTTNEEIKAAYESELIRRGIAPKEARKCAEIVLRDSKRERTPKEQATIQKAHNLMFGDDA